MRVNCISVFKWRNAPLDRAQRASSGGAPREGARSTPKRGSPRGVGSEARAKQRLAAGGAAPPTRNSMHLNATWQAAERARGRRRVMVWERSAAHNDVCHLRYAYPDI